MRDRYNIIVQGQPMSKGKKLGVEETLKRIDELLNVLDMIARDLREVSKALREGAPTAAPPVAPAGRAAAVDDIRVLFPGDLEELLEFEETEGYIKIKPRGYLGSDKFAKIASIVRGAGGEYVSAGRDSHFRISKETL